MVADFCVLKRNRTIHIIRGRSDMEAFMVDYASLMTRLQELSEKCIRVEENVREITEVTENLDIFWDGDANGAFVMAINEDIAFIEAVIICLRTNIRLLNMAYKEYQETEKVINKIIGGLRM